MTVEERLVFQGGTTIDQGQERVEVTAWLYSKDAAPSVCFTGRRRRSAPPQPSG
jgi:hypothetical protein